MKRFIQLKKPLAKQLVEAKRSDLQTLLKQAEDVATEELEQLKTRAVEQAQSELGGELERLTQLSERNDSVREDELVGMQQRVDGTVRALGELRCVLDAVRVFGVA